MLCLRKLEGFLSTLGFNTQLASFARNFYTTPQYPCSYTEYTTRACTDLSAPNISHDTVGEIFYKSRALVFTCILNAYSI